MTQHFIKTKIIKIAAVCCALFVMAKAVSAQQLSTYEQKRLKLAEETIKEMGTFDQSLSFAILLVTAKATSDGGFDNKLIEMYFIEDLIESLGTSSSSIGSGLSYYTKEKVNKIYNTWKTNRQTLDRTRTQADINRERKLKPVDGTIDKMIFLVRMEFGKWAKRGEYEKTVDYQNRLNTLGVAVFDSICNEILTEAKICFSSPAAKVIEERYDPDKEQYIGAFTYGNDSYKGRVSLLCSISPDKARWYKIGTITKMSVDGKWLIPAESEYEANYVGVGQVYCKTKFTTTAKTIPLRICFKDIKFGYNDICDELKNHCFTCEEFNDKRQAYYNNLYNYRESIKKRINKLKEDYSKLQMYQKFGDWFVHYVPIDDEYYFLYYENIETTLRYNLSKNSYSELQEYEAKYSNIEKMLNAAEIAIKEMIEARLEEESNQLTSKELEEIMDRYKNYDEIKTVSIDGKQITFIISKKEQIQGVFYSNKLKNTIGKPYKGKYEKALCVDGENLILCKRCNEYNGRCNYFLIVSKKDAHILSSKAVEQLKQHFYF